MFRAVAVVAAVLTLLAPATAVAAPVVASEAVVDVQTTATDIVAPVETTAGTVTFRVSTTDSKSGWIGLVRLRNGAAWETFRDAYRRVGSTDRAQILQGSRELAAYADLLGGVQTHVGAPGTFTQRLDAGDYVLFDHQDFRNTTEPRHRTLRVRWASGQSDEAGADATITAKVVDGIGPRYLLSGTFTAGRPIRFVSAMRVQVNEAILWELAPGATEDDLKAWIAGFGDTGQFPSTPPPFASPDAAGILPISAGRSVTAVPPLHAGRYVVLQWMKDAGDGTMLLKKGMYAIFTVHQGPSHGEAT
jgi:hypothetical protein